MDAQPPPQRHAKGQRQALDNQWLTYLNDGGDPGDGHQLAESPRFRAGIAAFNQQKFLEAHESFEQAWNDAPYPDRLLPLALAKLAASWARTGHGEQQSPTKVSRDATHILLALPPTYARINLAALTSDRGPHQREPLNITLKQ